MTETGSQYGKVGALTLALGGIAFGFAITTQEAGADPDGLTQTVGFLALALFAIGIVALVKMMFDIYGEEEL